LTAEQTECLEQLNEQLNEQTNEAINMCNELLNEANQSNWRTEYNYFFNPEDVPTVEELEYLEIVEEKYYKKLRCLRNIKMYVEELQLL
jgi:hypothetical protein